MTREQILRYATQVLLMQIYVNNYEKVKICLQICKNAFSSPKACVLWKSVIRCGGGFYFEFILSFGGRISENAGTGIACVFCIFVKVCFDIAIALLFDGYC